MTIQQTDRVDFVGLPDGWDGPPGQSWGQASQPRSTAYLVSVAARKMVANAVQALAVTALLVVGGRLVLRAMIGSSIGFLDDTGQWILFTAWDIEAAARTAPWPICAVAVLATVYALAWNTGHRPDRATRRRIRSTYHNRTETP